MKDCVWTLWHEGKGKKEKLQAPGPGLVLSVLGSTAFPSQFLCSLLVCVVSAVICLYRETVAACE